MHLYVHEDALGVRGEAGVHTLEPWCTISVPRVPVNQALSLLGGVRALGENFGGTDKASGLL